MTFSVAMCTYNGARYLGQQLQSILGQTCLPDEVIVCDDGSSDETTQLLRDFAKIAPFGVRLEFNTENLGVAKNFEKAINLCQGDLIALADQDDIWYPQKLAQLDAMLKCYPAAGFVFSNADVIDETGNPLGYTLWQSVRFNRRQQRQVTTGDALSVLLKHPVVTGATMALRAEMRSAIFPIPEAWIHDEWIALNASIMRPVALIQHPLMGYRRHTKNLIGAESTRLRDRLRVGLSTSPLIYRARYQQYQALRAHVAQREPNNAFLLQKLDEKAAHLCARGSMPKTRLGRLPKILRELIAGRYARYSGSNLNAARDLLRRF